MKQGELNFQLLSQLTTDRIVVLGHRARRSNLVLTRRMQRYDNIEELTRFPKKYEYAHYKRRNRSFEDKQNMLLEVQISLRRKSFNEQGPISSKQLNLLEYMDKTFVQQHIQTIIEEQKIKDLIALALEQSPEKKKISFRCQTQQQLPQEVRQKKQSICAPFILPMIAPVPRPQQMAGLIIPEEINNFADMMEDNEQSSFASTPPKLIKKQKSYTLSILTPRVRQHVLNYVTSKVDQLQTKVKTQYNSPGKSNESIQLSPNIVENCKTQNYDKQSVLLLRGLSKMQYRSPRMLTQQQIKQSPKNFIFNCLGSVQKLPELKSQNQIPYTYTSPQTQRPLTKRKNFSSRQYNMYVK